MMTRQPKRDFIGGAVAVGMIAIVSLSGRALAQRQRPSRNEGALAPGLTQILGLAWDWIEKSLA
jgi:hypothetical protein